MRRREKVNVKLLYYDILAGFYQWQQVESEKLKETHDEEVFTLGIAAAVGVGGADIAAGYAAPSIRNLNVALLRGNDAGDSKAREAGQSSQDGKQSYHGLHYEIRCCVVLSCGRRRGYIW